ncbi:hypothetical protein TTHERM_001217221 (macronuclear) [Tetrahymena thermophila SB210]|uniref:Zinc carboxypeptidase family protein n=1 Tax=Tetrahymena thermophila (strain SB210) TaxID=312017 RepID=W7XLA3_TETTS|nr:hypothetical protein TTHERM_001217221 [Tetrahymena thermophila SB210]EWS75939.1 hypothetical protein TTHERM_001217221 [Tetrahymena thermophila SB210]|eukprot:XP_012651523.1 hypothetical protein TTHERM_001217221 [Tetrahymena thermophila SB210]
MDQTNNKFLKTCNKHSQNQITFLKVISDQRDSSIFYCIDCVNEDLSFKGIDHVLIPQIISQSEKNIIQKWPPVIDYSILEKLGNEISNENSSISAIQQINNFFEELKVEITKKIDFCQKKMINQALDLPLGKEQILNKYKEISQIETLKQILGSYQDQFESQEIKFRAFLSEIISKKEENTQQLQNLLEQCQRKKQLINFEQYMPIKQSIYTLIDSINFFPNDPNQFNQSNTNPLNNQRHSNTQKIIELISNKSNFCSQEFLEQLRSDYLNCISSNILEKDKKYILRIQLEVTSQDEHYFYIGLMQKSQSDLIQGYQQKLSCSIKKIRGEFQHINGQGIDQYKKGNKLVYYDDFKLMLELRVWLGGYVLQILDYPKYEYQLELEDKFKIKLTEYDDLCLYLYLFSENRKYIIKEALQVEEFDF